MLVHIFLVATLACFASAAPTFDDWRVSGGQRARLGQFPFAAWINLGGSVCSGSILNSNSILTAAHCTYKKSASKLTVYTGMTSTKDSSRKTHK